MYQNAADFWSAGASSSIAEACFRTHKHLKGANPKFLVSKCRRYLDMYNENAF